MLQQSGHTALNSSKWVAHSFVGVHTALLQPRANGVQWGASFASPTACESVSKLPMAVCSRRPVLLSTSAT